jgi:hypothetical protein
MQRRRPRGGSGCRECDRRGNILFTLQSRPRMSLALFFALYCLEAGLVFLVAPWTQLWTLNPLLHRTVGLALFVDNPFVRGFISGVGIIHLMVGVRDLVVISKKPKAE